MKVWNFRQFRIVATHTVLGRAITRIAQDLQYLASF